MAENKVITAGVTGHKGFIGSNLCRTLKEQNFKIITTEDVYVHYGNGGHAFFNHFSNCDFIVHLAGVNKGSAEHMLEDNMLMTLSLAEFCYKKSKKLIVVGTTYNTDDAYKRSKDAANAVIKCYADVGLDVAFIKAINVVGKGCKPFYNSFVSTLMYLKSKNKEYIHLIKDINKVIELVDVSWIVNKTLQLINDGFLGYQEILIPNEEKIQISFQWLVDFFNGTNLNKKNEAYFTDLLNSYKDYR